MSKQNETVVLLVSLLMTLALIVGGLIWFWQSSFNPWGVGATPRSQIAAPSDSQTRTTPIISLAVTEDGQTLVTGDYAGTITLWDIETRSPSQLTGHQGRVTSLATLQGRLVSGSGDGSVRLWDMANAYEIQRPLTVGARVLSLAWLPMTPSLLAIAMAPFVSGMSRLAS